MKAIQFDVSVPRYVLGKALGPLYKPFYWSGFSCLRYGDLPEPDLPGPDWVKIRTRYGGICGTDLSLLHLHSGTYLEPFASDRFIVGHENLGTIVEVGSQIRDWALGERVIADLMLPCAARGIAEPCPACQEGRYNLCQNFAEGDLAPGTILGSCADTGGSWGPVYVAHQSQLVRVPDNVSDENAILVDAVSSALHPILQHFPDDTDTVLVLGAGTIGLCAVASLRALGSKARILTLAKYSFQGDLARRLGADEVVHTDRKQGHYRSVAELTGAKVYEPVLGKPVLVGGVDTVYECVGNDSGLDDALRLARAGGRVVIVGAAGVPKGVDWSPIWFHELTVVGSYAVSAEDYQDQHLRTYEVCLQLMAEGKLDLTELLTHTYPLAEYRKAFRILESKQANRALKVAFSFD